MFILRKLQKTDYYCGYLELLSQLTTVGNISYQDFANRFDELNSIIYVIQNTKNQQIVASGAILIEYKFIHNAGLIGHIEDIVVDKDSRGCGLGRQLIDQLIQVALQNKCYKVILNCNSNVINFYQKLGFSNTKNNKSLSKYFS